MDVQKKERKKKNQDNKAALKTARPRWDVEKFLETAGMSASAQPVIADVFSRPIPAICSDLEGPS